VTFSGIVSRLGRTCQAAVDIRASTWGIDRFEDLFVVELFC
jgi:hypothetical protein